MTQRKDHPFGKRHASLPRAYAAFAALALLWTASATAAPPQSSAGGPPQVNIEYEKYTLPNGLEVILHEDHTVPIVAVNTWYHVGPANETPGRTGFAHLFEHIMFQSSGHVGEDQFWKYTEGAGASFVNGTTDLDRTNYLEDMPSNQLELALWLESDRMGFLLDRLTEASLANQRDVVRNERREGENAPYGLLEEELFHQIYPKGHPYYAYVIGSHEDIQAAKLEDVRDFFKRYYCPNNATLVLAGDIDKAKAKALIEKYYGPIPRGPDVPPIQATTPPITQERRVTITDKVELPRVLMGWISPAIYKPGSAEAVIAADILGGGRSSRLYKSLVYEKQIAQDVRASQDPYALGSVFEISATAKPGHTVEELSAAIDAELAKMASQGPTAAEVDAARNGVYSGTLFSLERMGGFGGVADRLNQYNHHLKDPGYLTKSLATYAAVTAEAVQKFAADGLSREHRAVVFCLPGEKQLPPDPATPPAPEKKEEAKVESAEPWRNTPPGPGPTPGAQLPMPKRLALSNGLTVYFVEARKLPLVAATLMVRSGSAQDPTTLPGLAGFTSSMLDEGTSKRDALAIADELHALGASLGTNSTWDGSSISCRSLKQTAGPAMTILSDVALHPAFPDKEVERVRKERLTSLLQQRDDPQQIASRVIRTCLYGPTHPYGHVALGTSEAIEKTARADMVKFYESMFTPKNAALVLVGDLSESEAKKLAQDALGSWKGAPVSNPRPSAGTTAGPRVVIVDKPGTPQTALRVGQFGLMRSDPDFEKLDLANTILGGLFSSRVNMNLREEHGYSYGAFSALVESRGQGPLILGAGVRMDVTGASIEEILKEVKGIVDRPITEEELRMAKEASTRTLPALFETTGSTSGTIAGQFIYELPLDYYRTLPARLNAITIGAVQATAKKYYAPDRMLVVAVGDRSKIEPQIAKLNLGSIAFRDPDGKEIPATAN